MAKLDLDSEQAQRLAAAARRRRRDLGDPPQVEIATRAGISLAAYQKIEKGRPGGLMPRTIDALDRGLLWQEGSAERVILGGSPLPDDHPRPVVEEFRDATGAIRHRITVDRETGEALPVEALAGQIAASGTEEIRVLTRLLSIEAPQRAYVIAILDRILDLVDSV